MTLEKGPVALAGAEPGEFQSDLKHSTSRPGSEGEQLSLFAPSTSPVARSVDVELEPPRNRSETSCGAARRIKRIAPTQRQRVLRCIQDAGVHGRTDDEIAAELGMFSHSVCPRRLELQLCGLVRPAGERPTRAGRSARVWLATEAAEERPAGSEAAG